MSKTRAKKKQRQRARTVSGVQTPAAGAAAERAAERTAARQAPAVAERRPSRLEERDGIPRPDPPWAPFPLTEIAMAAGIVLFGIGFFSAGDDGPYVLAIGVVILGVVAGELCLREHFAGFRSHSILLGLLPVTAVHMVVFYAFTRAWTGPVALVVDLSVAGALAFLLQRRFRVARERASLRR